MTPVPQELRLVATREAVKLVITQYAAEGT